MATVTDTQESKTPTEKAEQKECSTRDLLREINEAITKEKLQQEIHNQNVTALEEHLRQVEDYDKKITTATDTYAKGRDTFCAGLKDLKEAVKRSKDSYECLVGDDKKKDVSDVLDKLRGRRTTLESCKWKLRKATLDKTRELELANLVVAKADEQLNELLALLESRSKELSALKTLNETIGCSDTVRNECRYAFYLDLVKRLDEIDCPEVHSYTYKLVDQVQALDAARKKVREIDEQARDVKDQLARVTKLYDDLVKDWQAELCQAVTAGSVTKLPDDIAKVCATDATPAGQAGTEPAATGEAEQAEQQEARDKPDGENEASPDVPPQEKGA